ncbi:MAG: type I phosphomannose isomerase catalytic subunit [Fusobacteriaceae bacterium]
MYPLKFNKNLIKKIWGGRSFEDLGIELVDNELYGESWEVSSHKNGMSIVANGEFAGKSLQELLDNYKENLVGETVYEKYKEKFPLLIKYLDIHDKLSIQVHPDDSYALMTEGEYGKSETWYILDASPDATVIMGVKEGITKENFLKRFENEDFHSIFNIIKVKKGDFINVKPGLVHASLTGSVLICEIQQNSDTTYRIYDFDRLVDGKLRPLNLEKAMEVIDFNMKPIITTYENRKVIELKNCKKEELVRNQYFNIDKLIISGDFKDEINKNFKIYSVISGKGELLVDNKKYIIEKAETYFIPANLLVEIFGEVEILKSYL